MHGVYKPQKRVYNQPNQTSDGPYRTDIVRMTSNYDDIGHQVVGTYRTYLELESKVAPLIARNSDNDLFLLTKERIGEMVKNSHGMNPTMFRHLLDSVEKFFLKNKSKRRLPSPHIISHRSVQYGEVLFTIDEIDVAKYLEQTKNRVRNFKVNTVHKVEVEGLNPFYIENMRRGNYRHMILRPKLGKSGAPMPDRWEILLFGSSLGYLVDHIDTDKNPRYNGSIT